MLIKCSSFLRCFLKKTLLYEDNVEENYVVLKSKKVNLVTHIYNVHNDNNTLLFNSTHINRIIYII